MKIRVGVSYGTDGTADPDVYGPALDAMEALGFDSVWLAERIGTDVPDVIAGLGYAAARTSRLRLGLGVLVLPGRHPARVAKQLASLDRLSAGRLLVAFGLGVADDRHAFPVASGRRGDAFDEALAGVRAGLGTVRPEPVQRPLDLWVGGTAPAALVRAGRLSDGWLPSLITPSEAGEARRTVEEEAARAGRAVDPEHFGVTLAYADDGIPAGLAALVARRRPGVDPAGLVPQGLRGTREHITRFVDAGFSKFVVRPARTPVDWPATLREMAEELLPLQS